MRNNRINKLVVSVSACAFLAVSVVGVALLSGCSKELSGEVTGNQKPIVRFVNIPPEGQKFSRNPQIFWFGSDNDGLIDSYRYHIATEAAVQAADLNDPLVYISSVDDTMWIELEIDPTDPDPQTSTAIELTADSASPVLTFVSQYVFLQAFDTEGMGSDIVFRKFKRNNNPPQTFVLGIAADDLPFVNSVVQGGVITGIKMRWLSVDEIDYPNPDDAPPFEYEWRLYGPYTDDEFADLQSRFYRMKYVTRDGRVFDTSDVIEICDTSLTGDSIVVSCNTFSAHPDSAGLPAAFGFFEDWFAVEDDEFQTSNTLNRIVESSTNGIDEWVLDEDVLLFNAYRNASFDTTVEMNFVFWVRSRDDAKVPDLVPAFKDIRVLDPKYERNVLVLDYTDRGSFSRVSSSKLDSAMAYWDRTINAWNPEASFDTTIDYLKMILDFPFGPPLRSLLQHKVIILYSDMGTESNFEHSNIFKAIEGGVNAWMTMRAPIFGGPQTPPNFGNPMGVGIPVCGDANKQTQNYCTYFGVVSTVYSGWFCTAIAGELPGPCLNQFRLEDFVGTFSMDQSRWPDLTIDSANLHQRYNWHILGPRDANFVHLYGWEPEIAALPEVNWSVRRTPGTEAMYLYKSLYGSDHPLGFIFTFEGSPVAHRFSNGVYRTVHFNFTPLGMEDANMQVVTNDVLDWLYDADLSAAPTRIRYPDAQYKVSLQSEREQYWQEFEERNTEIESPTAR
ncbi:MAG: hypothetical protein ACE5FH_04040 [Candidatus Zixiibacteriota bacterium]